MTAVHLGPSVAWPKPSWLRHPIDRWRWEKFTRSLPKPQMRRQILCGRCMGGAIDPYVGALMGVLVDRLGGSVKITRKELAGMSFSTLVTDQSPVSQAIYLSVHHPEGRF